MAELPAQHWADRAVDQLLAERGSGPFLVASGISPSGRIHVGNLREVLTADIICRVLRERGLQARLIFVADDYDSLRKVYPFLDPQRYAPYVGAPLSEIPAPEGEGTYAEYFLRPFLASLERLKVSAECIRASHLYRSGALLPQILQALHARDTIAQILARITGKEIEPDWSPFMPQCSQCKSLLSTTLLAWDPNQQTVTYRCTPCALQETVPILGHGKLTWRVDWPARWAALRVDVEPFGKDHGGKGGSYDTGKEIVAQVFGFRAPFPLVYEWIRLKGMGDMSSSKGNVVAVDEVLEVIPPDVLRYFITRPAPKVSLALDLTDQMLTLVDEVDDVTKKQRDPRAVQLSQAGGFLPIGIPFNHLVNVVQVAQGDLTRVKEILRRTGYSWTSDQALDDRCRYALRWLDRFAPDDVKFRVQPQLPHCARSLPPNIRAALTTLAAAIAQPAKTSEDFHRAFYDTAALHNLPVADLFRAFYLALIGKERGPRAGWFTEIIGPLFVAQRLREAAAP
ncbi:MAG: lysine--tRNA ligase [bacterium]|nr:lysine--tRNA ligase [bacterium]